MSRWSGRNFADRASDQGTLMPSYRDGRRTVVHLERCRRLRRDATDAERRLWQMLRAGRLQGFKFRRQHELGPYVLDFVCVERRLVVEADGGQHFDPEGQQRDRLRDAWLRSRGWTVLRLDNRLILLQSTVAQEEIVRHLAAAPSP